MSPLPEQHARVDDDSRLLARAARAAGTAAALFTYDDAGREHACRSACGGIAAACAYAAARPWGAQACRLSRETAAQQALQRNRTTPFICHLGFACVVAPINREAGEAVVFGPYLAAHAPDLAALETAVRAGLQQLPQTGDEQVDPAGPLPFSLEDVPLRSADSVVAVAEWCAETLAATPTAAQHATGAISQATEDRAQSSGKRRRVAPTIRDPHNGAAIAAAIAAGDTARVRQLVRAELAAPACSTVTPMVSARARATAVAAAVLDRAAAAGLDTASAWERWDAFQAALAAATAAPQQRAALTRFFRALRPRGAGAGRIGTTEPARIDETIAALDAWLAAQWPNAVTLEAAAEALDMKPATLTKRLQRAFDLPFTQYVNRRRVARAKTLLVQTRLSISAIAQRVGIDEGANLARLFRRHEGMSPTQFRRRYKR